VEEALLVPGIEEIFFNVSVGDLVKKPKSNIDKSAHIIAVGDTLEEAELSVN